MIKIAKIINFMRKVARKHAITSEKIMNIDSTLLEGTSGMWHYHLGEGGKALCGDIRVMSTKNPSHTWGMKSNHISYSYCTKCEKIAIFEGNCLTGNIV